MRVIASFCLALFSLLCSGGLFAQQGAVLSAGESTHEIGQALFFQNSDQCYVLMPTHVLAEHGGQPRVIRYYRNNKYYAQTSLVADLGDDLSLLQASNLPLSACGNTSGSMRQSIDFLLNNTSRAQLKAIDVTGGQVLQAVDVIDVGAIFLHMNPSLEKMSFYKGQSGSMVLIDQEPVGMLLSINARQGNAKVLRQNVIMDKLKQYFSSAAASPAEIPQRLNTLVQEVQSTDLSYINQEAENLFSATEDERVWYVPKVESNVAIIKALLAEQNAISRFSFDVGAISKELWPTHVAIFFDSTDRGRWHQLVYKELDFQEGVVTVQFPSRLMKNIEFRFYPQQKNGAISLRRILLAN